MVLAQSLQFGQMVVNVLSREQTEPLGVPGTRQGGQRGQEISMTFVGMQIGDDGEYERAAGNTQNPARGRAIHHLLREGADVYSVMNQMQLGFVYVFLSQIAQHRM